MNDARGPGGWHQGPRRAAGRSGPPESRPQLEELLSGEWVTESGRTPRPLVTGPARLAYGAFVNNAG